MTSQSNEYFYGMYMRGIKRGNYTFDDVGVIAWKKQMMEELLKEVDAGTINDHARASLVKYIASEVEKGRIARESIPSSVADEVKEVLG
jgi:hypothetical protein